MKPSVYIETTVVSYLTARPSKNLVVAGHQAATRDFWNRLPDFEAFISELVVEEASKGDEVAAEARLRELETNDLYALIARPLANKGNELGCWHECHVKWPTRGDLS